MSHFKFTWLQPKSSSPESKSIQDLKIFTDYSSRIPAVSDIRPLQAFWSTVCNKYEVICTIIPFKVYKEHVKAVMICLYRRNPLDPLRAHSLGTPGHPKKFQPCISMHIQRSGEDKNNTVNDLRRFSKYVRERQNKNI